MRISKFAAALALVGVASIARAELKPDEIVILATPTHTSREVARYYAEHRGVPANHIVVVDMKPDADVDRDVWDATLRPKIRALLAEHKLDAKVRCLVTSWDVPLRIGPRDAARRDAAARGDLLTEARAERLARLNKSLRALDAVCAPGHPKPRTNLDPKEPVWRHVRAIESAFSDARQRMEKADVFGKIDGAAALEKHLVEIHGLGRKAQLAAGAQRVGKIPPAVMAALTALGKEAVQLDRDLGNRMAQVESPARDRAILDIMDKLWGAFRTLAWIDEQLASLKGNESQASFDSELALLFWENPHALERWLPNGLYYAAGPSPPSRRTVMTARLSGPSVETVVKMIDTSIAVEKTGLTGKVYLDARGIVYKPEGGRGGYGEYDQSLRDLAARLRKHTKLDVTLDDQSALFAAGQCPDAAVYCGWYSLANYVDAFAWRPGAVGYHIASSEATNLRKPNTQWCASMLERGVAGTLGPTFEPYLSAFPLPDEFFPLLLTGRMGLAETYWRTCPFTSWAMVLVGDPLYNPFKNRPAFPEKELPQRMRARLFGPTAAK